MKITHEKTCTEPGRWPQPPPADAPDAEILAYLRHCDACAYHAKADRDDGFDALLRQASRDLPVMVPPRPRRRLWPSRRDRPAVVPTLAERIGYERRLAQACLAAFCVVVLFVAFQAEALQAPNPAAQATVAASPAPLLTPGRLAATLEAGRPYIAAIQEATPEAASPAAARAGLPEARVAGLEPGSRLLVTNPLTGAVAEVVVARQAAASGEIVLPVAVAQALGFEERAVVIVEILSTPPPPMFGP